MGEVISIVSGKGGVGKTVTTANLGAAFTLLGKKVIVIDGDIGLRNLDIVMGLEDKVLYNIVDVLEGNCKLSEAVIKDKRYESLYLLPAAQFVENKTSINKDKILTLYNKLKNEFDYILIDTPSGLNEGFKQIVVGSDRALAIVMQDNSSIRDSDRVIRELSNLGINNCQIIFNKYDSDLNDFNIDYISEDLCMNIIGVILNDKDINLKANKGILINKEMISEIENEYLNIVKRIMGENIPLVIPENKKVIPQTQEEVKKNDVNTSKKSLWDKIKSIFNCF